MNIRLHENATTTPRIRALIPAGDEPQTVPARYFGVTVQTLARWKLRDFALDRSHTAHRRQTTLTPGPQAIMAYRRRAPALDDLLAVARAFRCPQMSRFGLDRCLRRHGVGPLRAPRPASAKAAVTPFKAAPFRIGTLLTDDGKAFTDRFVIAGGRSPAGQHRFDQRYPALGIDHRLTRPRHPQTKGMGEIFARERSSPHERCNGRVADLLHTPTSAPVRTWSRRCTST